MEAICFFFAACVFLVPLRGSFFVPEDLGDMMLPKVGLCPNYTKLEPGDLTLEIFAICAHSRLTLLISVPRRVPLFNPL
jgi:hypothetical protein